VSRGRTYRIETVLEAAKETFWRLGYDGAAVSDLEAATGLRRSSLYQAFGSKARLFASALDAYICGFIGPLLEPLEAKGAPADALDRFVRQLREMFAEDGLPARYGCLWVNSIVEFAGRGEAPVDVRAAEFWDRMNGAFRNALRCAAPRERDGLTPSDDRADLLAAAAFAGWLTVRVDAPRAQAVCDRMLVEMSSWWLSANASA
jgi:AcrR family transcriptional regulator